HIPIRLNGGFRGSLMLNYNGRWGYVCYSSHQRAYQFNSVCRYLGFSSAYSISEYYESQPAIVQDFFCPGYSNSNGVDDCTGRKLGTNNYCTYKLYIECDSSPITTEESVTTSLYSVDTSGSYTNVRLVGGNYYWEGRVEIYHNGAWGTICDDNFDTNEAKVICTMLGYNRYGSVTAYGSAAFGEGRGSIMLDDLQCNGYESDISHCASNGWNHHNCGHGEDASVSCRYPKSGGNSITTDSVTTEESVTTLPSVETSGTYTNVRLVGGNYYWEGRVEIYHIGVWGTICDDDFDTNEAKVICAMLGFNRYGSVTAYGNAAFGEGSGSIMLDDLNCNGYENDISQCSPRRWNHHNCGHSEDASVSCRYPKSGGRNEVTTVSFLDRATTADVLGRHGHISFRLTNGGYGLLEIYYKGRWGYVCHNYNQQREEFNSACRYLGYSSAVRINSAIVTVFNDRSHSAIVTDFHCPRSYYYYFLFPNGIDDCTGSRLGYSNYCNNKLYIECGTYVDATTVEYEVTTADVLGTHGHIPVRLTYGGEGYLQIYYNGRWGYVCHNSSQSTYQFNSVCRNLGYSSAHYVYGRYDSSHTALVTDLQCPGSYYYYSSSNGIDDCTGDRLGYNTYCNDKLYIECDSITTEETATVPFKTGCQSVTSSPADVIFVVDESGSVGSDNFAKTRASIVDTIRHLDIRNDFVRIGVMTFDDNSRTVFNLNNYPGDPNSMVNRVMSMPYSSGGTDIADALSHACSYMFTSFNGDRSNATNYLVLLTDGQSRAQQEADRCEAGGTKIISVGIGDSIDEQVLRNLAYNYDYYLSTNYSDIAGFLPKLVTTAVNCGGLESTNARHITVNCQHSSWYVKVHLPPLEQQYSDFKETDIYLGSHSCTGTRSGDYLIFNEDYTTCGTNKIASANGVIYTNTLVYAVHDPNQPYIVHEYRFQISVECDMSKRESGENNINNIHGNLEQQTISGVGHFVVQLKFFSDSNFQHEFNGFPPSYMVGHNVYVKATTPIHDYNVKMRLSDCYTKPSKSASDSYIYYLIKNGCPVAPSAFITTKSTHETRFHFQDFEYAFHPDSMYVHCNATFCHTNDYSRDCEPRCGNRKRVGSIDQEDEPIEGVGPIGYAEDEATVLFQKGSEALNAGKKPEVENKGNKPLYVVGVVVVAVAMVAILVVTSIYFRSKRRQNGQSKIV
ncbi:Hypothetical predicted protein, partial [Mytilus galloprovincialis]